MEDLRLPKALQEHPYRTAEIVLLANVSEPRVLQWHDEYSDKKEPMSFQPLMNEHGACLYQVPFAYAERLLRGEPNKYKLLEPKRVVMRCNTLNGGFERKSIFAWVPDFDQKGIIKKERGIPKYREMTQAEKDAALKEQQLINEGRK